MDIWLPFLSGSSRLDIHVMLRCQHGLTGFGWVLRWNAAGFLSLTLSLSLERCSGLPRMFDGFTGEEIWSGWGGAVLRRGYTKGVMDACFRGRRFREEVVGSGESVLIVQRDLKILRMWWNLGIREIREAIFGNFCPSKMRTIVGKNSPDYVENRVGIVEILGGWFLRIFELRYVW